ncbi:hypothetical protein GQ53DRAFT_748038 [Thozetella sp. PMI_491]|nr:hypothetical protein GQ53DRAFT_748038 [Thozetella sp. PMI_491]
MLEASKLFSHIQPSAPGFSPYYVNRYKNPLATLPPRQLDGCIVLFDLPYFLDTRPPSAAHV